MILPLNVRPIHTSHPKKLAKSIALELPDDYEPGYNISPGRSALSIKCNNKDNIVTTMMVWGLRTPQNFHINARIESAKTILRFREVGKNTDVYYQQMDFTNGTKMEIPTSPQ